MTKDEDLFVSKLKPYHIILISCLLCTVMILNSNYVNEQRAKERLNKEMGETYNEMMSLRRLEGNSNSDKVCSKGSDDLIEYYKTGDLSLIDLEEGAIKCEDKDASYMKALRGLARKLLGDSDESNDNTLRNLDEGDSTKDNLMQYLDRILPMAVFLVIGILSIFGWIGCCICNCCDCCCCCCCKKRTCKIPCFIFTYVYYALVVAISVYGLAESNKIFKGLANTECSLLKFFDQVIDGEIKQSLPRWAGIEGINDILDGISDALDQLDGPSIETYLSNKMESSDSDSIASQKEAFKGQMTDIGDTFFDPSGSDTYSDGYLTGDYGSGSAYVSTLTTPSKEISGKYILDLVKDFGKCSDDGDDGLACTPKSILFFWYIEYQGVSSSADDYMRRARSSFNTVLDESSITAIKTSLGKGKDALDKIKKPFDDVNKKIGGTLSDYSDKIDDYGKLVVKIVFSVLMVMNIALAVLMTLIGLFSMKACVDCCFCRCLFKSCVHILWNVLALMMILSFLVGSILALVGRIGGDIMSLASFIFSEENFDAQNPLFLNEMGDDGKRYLRRCILLNGDIGAELGISTQDIDALDDISEIESQITNALNTFDHLKTATPTYNKYVDLLKARYNLSMNFNLTKIGDSNNYFSFDELVNSMNEKIDPSSNTWSRTGTNTDCTASVTNKNILSCYANFGTQYPNTNDIGKYAEVIKDSYTLVKKAYEDSNNLKSVMGTLNEKYGDYLGSYKTVLTFLQGKIGTVMDQIREYATPGSSFSFLNGHFILTNLKILLKYLKHSLGKDLYTVGVCLIVVGCSLILSISSTILLIVIINIGLKEDMNMKNNPTGMEVSQFQINNPTTKVGPQY